jgi:uncharacterized protein involved in exopolysaccharide biosynthesis
VERNVEIAVEMTSQTLDELLRQLEPIRTKIRANEQELLSLARERGLYVPESQTITMSERISQLQKELTELQSQRGNLEAIFQEISRIEEQGSGYQTLPQLASDTEIQELNRQANSLEKDLERLSVSYLDKHPKVVEARSQLQEVRRDIAAQTDKIISRIKAEYSIALQNESSLQERLTRSKEASLDLSVASTDYNILRSEIEEDRRIYDLILSRIKEIDLNQDTLNNNLRVLDEAILPSIPVRPKKAVNLIAGCLLGRDGCLHGLPGQYREDGGGYRAVSRPSHPLGGPEGQERHRRLGEGGLPDAADIDPFLQQGPEPQHAAGDQLRARGGEDQHRHQPGPKSCLGR